jgi:cytochrome c peroxidase
MKKWVGIVVVLAAVAALAIPVVNLVNGGPRNTAMATCADPQGAAVAAVLETKCANCHAAGTPMPFYASWPIAKPLVTKDVARGLTWADLGRELNRKDPPTVSDATLAKLERVVSKGTMPPARFTLLHWSARLSDAERSQVIAWIHEARKATAPAGLPGAVAALGIVPIPLRVEADAAKAALGEKLYNDKRLSGDDTLSCATCHDLAKGGTDQLPVSLGIRGQKGGINAPTTFNARWQVEQFWDGRARDLKAQAGGPPLNPIEMGATWEGILAKLDADKAFAAEFKAVYPEGFSEDSITDAIAEYEKTLTTPNSRFDKFLMGQKDALSAQEVLGWTRFQEIGCATCHSGVLLGGTSFERMGREGDYFGDRGTPAEADLGRFNHTKDPADKHFFKVPTLRNIALTYPYFHDASAPDLVSAEKAMAKYQVGVTLSETDAKDMEAFLRSLTGEFQGKQL